MIIPGKRVLVIGDLVLDRYIYGRPARIAREAPVMILEQSHIENRPGGAGNLAANLAALDARVTVVGAMGQDYDGLLLRRALNRAGINIGWVTLIDRPTTTKTRLVAGGEQERQQIVARYDTAQRGLTSEKDARMLMDDLKMALREPYDAIFFSDYENGVMYPPLISQALMHAQHNDIPTFADSHGELARFTGVTAITPNQPELETLLEHPLGDDYPLEHGMLDARQRLSVDYLVVTRGSQGLAIADKDGVVCYNAILRDQYQVVDPNGAGDTVAAVFALDLISGADARLAALNANMAASHVVRRMGPATTTRDEIWPGASSIAA